MTNIEATDTTLHAVATGSGPGLVLAHGAGGSAENWAPVLDALGKEHRVLAVDYPGSGTTPAAGEVLDLDDLVDRLVATATADGLDRFVLVAHSMGCIVGVRAATRHPERVRALVLTAGLPHPSPRLKLALTIVQNLLKTDRRAATALLTFLGSTESMLRPLNDETLDATITAAVGMLQPGTDAQLALATAVDVRPELADINVPTLVIGATQDVMASPDLTRAFADAIDGAEYAELDAGHHVIGERGGEWLALVNDFLSRVEQGG